MCYLWPPYCLSFCARVTHRTQSTRQGYVTGCNARYAPRSSPCGAPTSTPNVHAKRDPIVSRVPHLPEVYQGNLASAMSNGVFGAHPRWPLRVTRRALVRTAMEVARGMLHLHEAGECQHIRSTRRPAAVCAPLAFSS